MFHIKSNLLCSLLCLHMCTFLHAETFVVDNTYNDLKTILEQEGVQNGDTILFTAGQTFTGSNNRRITFGPGDYDLTDLTFGRTGEGPNPIIDLEEEDRLFTIASTSTISINDLVIVNGRAPQQKAPSSSNSGGALRNSGYLTIFNCTFTNNSLASDKI